MSDEWPNAYREKAPKTVVSLSDGKKYLHFIDGVSMPLPWTQAEPEEEKRP